MGQYCWDGAFKYVKPLVTLMCVVLARGSGGKLMLAFVLSQLYCDFGNRPIMFFNNPRPSRDFLLSVNEGTLFITWI